MSLKVFCKKPYRLQINDTPIAKIEPEEGRESSDSVVHELTTDDIIHGSKKQSEKIKLPEVVPTPVPDIYISKDKIFGENPVFGPKDFIGTR